jgi:hypothetical protein
MARTARFPRVKPGLSTRVRCRWSVAKTLVMLGLAAPAHAQLPPSVAYQLNNDLANDAVSAIEVFSAANTVATGVFKYDNAGPDDVEFQTYKLPLDHSFGPTNSAIRPFVEGYLGYFDLRQRITSFGFPPGEIKIKSLTATAGGGATWQITDWLAASPRLLLAYSHAWHHFDRNALPGDPFANALPDWRLDALTLLPSLEVKLKHSLRRWDFGVNSRYTYSHVFGLNDTSVYIDLDSESHVWRNEITASYRSPWRVFDLSLRPFGLFARHDVAGQIRHSGFVEHFYEARLGLGLEMPTALKPIREASFSFAYYFQSAFTGYSVGLDIAF